MAELNWHKSSHSSTPGGQCVEIAVELERGFAVRDSKNPDGPALQFDNGFTAFVEAVKAGHFNK